MPQHSNLTPRREPRQARSRRQVNNMLDAAAHVFAEVGYDSATTNAIAERAGASIGSLYQFFPNKAAIFHALTMRYHAQMRDLVKEVVTVEAARLPLIRIIDSTIEALYRFARVQPGFTQIVISARSSAELVAAENALIQESIQLFDALLAVRAPSLGPDRRGLLAKVSVEAAHALLVLAIKTDQPDDEAVLQETKALLMAYLSPIIGDEQMNTVGA